MIPDVPKPTFDKSTILTEGLFRTIYILGFATNPQFHILYGNKSFSAKQTTHKW